MPRVTSAVREPAYSQAARAQRDRWMISYADMMTILLILFVAIAAAPMEQPHKSPPPPPPAAPAPQPRTPALLDVQKRLDDMGVVTHTESRGLVISLPQSVLFASGEDRIDSHAWPTVNKIADAIRPLPNRVALVGHSDSRPIRNGRFHDNWELSAARSLQLLRALSRECGIPESRLSVESLGSYDPRDTDITPQGRARNRRVEIVVLNSGY